MKRVTLTGRMQRTCVLSETLCQTKRHFLWEARTCTLIQEIHQDVTRLLECMASVTVVNSDIRDWYPASKDVRRAILVLGSQIQQRVDARTGLLQSEKA